MGIHRSLHFDGILIPNPRVIVTHPESGRSWGAPNLDRSRLADLAFERLGIPSDAQARLGSLHELVEVTIYDKSARPATWRTTLGRLKRWSDGEIRSNQPAPRNRVRTSHEARGASN